MEDRDFRNYIRNEIDFLEETRNLIFPEFILETHIGERLDRCYEELSRLDKIVEESSSELR